MKIERHLSFKGFQVHGLKLMRCNYGLLFQSLDFTQSHFNVILFQMILETQKKKKKFLLKERSKIIDAYVPLKRQRWYSQREATLPKYKPQRKNQKDLPLNQGKNQEIFVWGQGPSTKSQNRIIELLRFIGHGSSTLGKKSWDKCVVLFHHIFWNTLGTIDNLWEHARNTKFPKFKPHTHSPTPLNPSRKKEGPSWERIDPSNWLNENIKNIKINK